MPTPPDAAVMRRLALLAPSSFIPAPFASRIACKAVIAATGREHPSIAVTPSGILAVYLREATANSANAPPFYTQNTADQSDCHTYQI